MTDAEGLVWHEWGRPIRVKVEHSPVWTFARVVQDHHVLYASEKAALAAGFAGVPCPPTYTFAMSYFGAFPDLQPPDARSGPSALSNAGVGERGGLYLHGEQEFVYHRVPVVGDVLEGRMRVSEPYTKTGSRRAMQFTIYETLWSTADGEPVVSERITSIFLPDGAPTV